MGGSVGLLSDESTTGQAGTQTMPSSANKHVATTFNVSLCFNTPLIRIDLPPTFLLRISKESLDFVYSDSGLPIINFPYHSILCWNSDGSKFRFTLDDSGDITAPPSSAEKPQITHVIQLSTSKGKEIETNLMATIRYEMFYID